VTIAKICIFVKLTFGDLSFAKPNPARHLRIVKGIITLQNNGRSDAWDVDGEIKKKYYLWKGVT
jgi:hypothetical protein